MVNIALKILQALNNGENFRNSYLKQYEGEEEREKLVSNRRKLKYYLERINKCLNFKT